MSAVGREADICFVALMTIYGGTLASESITSIWELLGTFLATTTQLSLGRTPAGHADTFDMAVICTAAATKHIDMR
jgi:hypothetical protein